MRYLHTMVRISDIAVSLQFYCDTLGLHEVRRWESKAGRFTNIFLTTPGDAELAASKQAPLLELTYNWPSEDGTIEEYDTGRAFGHIAYEVDNIYDYCSRLQSAGVTIKRPPRDGRLAFISSPDGIAIELLQTGDPLPPQEPWSTMENAGSW